MQLDIVRAKIIRGDVGPDYLYLETHLPSGCWPYNGTVALKFEVAAGGGENYLQEHFPGLDFEVIDHHHKCVLIRCD